MTYCEIYNEVAGDEKNRLAELDLSTSHRAAWVIVKNLNDRSGFDAWWESIDDDIITPMPTPPMPDNFPNHFSYRGILCIEALEAETGYTFA